MNKEPAIIIKRNLVESCLLCGICSGYIVEATSITECLHSLIRPDEHLRLNFRRTNFSYHDKLTKLVCKSCIVKHVWSSRLCPKCKVEIHKTRPLLNLRSDKTLQEVINKLVPEIQEKEEQRKWIFEGLSNGTDLKKLTGSKDIKAQIEVEKKIAFRMQYLNSPNKLNADSEWKEVIGGYRKSYLRISSKIPMLHLQKFIRKKSDNIPEDANVILLFEERVLSPKDTLEDVELLHWKRSSSEILTINFAVFSRRNSKRTLPKIDEVTESKKPRILEVAEFPAAKIERSKPARRKNRPPTKIPMKSVEVERPHLVLLPQVNNTPKPIPMKTADSVFVDNNIQLMDTKRDRIFSDPTTDSTHTEPGPRHTSPTSMSERVAPIKLVMTPRQSSSNPSSSERRRSYVIVPSEPSDDVISTASKKLGRDEFQFKTVVTSSTPTTSNQQLPKPTRKPLPAPVSNRRKQKLMRPTHIRSAADVIRPPSTSTTNKSVAFTSKEPRQKRATSGNDFYRFMNISVDEALQRKQPVPLSEDHMGTEQVAVGTVNNITINNTHFSANYIEPQQTVNHLSVISPQINQSVIHKSRADYRKHSDAEAHRIALECARKAMRDNELIRNSTKSINLKKPRNRPILPKPTTNFRPYNQLPPYMLKNKDLLTASDRNKQATVQKPWTAEPDISFTHVVQQQLQQHAAQLSKMAPNYPANGSKDSTQVMDAVQGSGTSSMMRPSTTTNLPEEPFNPSQIKALCEIMCLTPEQLVQSLESGRKALKYPFSRSKDLPSTSTTFFPSDGTFESSFLTDSDFAASNQRHSNEGTSRQQNISQISAQNPQTTSCDPSLMIPTRPLSMMDRNPVPTSRIIQPFVRPSGNKMMRKVQTVFEHFDESWSPNSSFRPQMQSRSPWSKQNSQYLTVGDSQSSVPVKKSLRPSDEDLPLDFSSRSRNGSPQSNGSRTNFNFK